jgi:hypothetical protein
LADVLEANKRTVAAAMESLEVNKANFEAKVKATEEEIKELTK